MSSRTPTKVYDRGKHSGNPVCRFCSVYLGLKTTSIPVFVVTQRQEFKGVKLSELLSEFGIHLNECDSKSKRSCQKCARQIFNSCKFLSHLKLNMDDSQPENLTVKRLAKSSPSASLPEPFNARGELSLRSRKRLSLDKENNPPRYPQHYLEEEMKRLMNVPVEETQTITKVSWLITLSSFICFHSPKLKLNFDLLYIAFFKGVCGVSSHHEMFGNTMQRAPSYDSSTRKREKLQEHSFRTCQLDRNRVNCT